MAHLSTLRSQQAVPIRSVWSYNLEEEFALICQFARYCHFAAVDTEFPGVVYEAPMHPRHMSAHERYALIKKNVNCLKLIQLGLTLCTSDSGAGAFMVWEFNFRGFNPLQDAHSASSIKLLESQGLDPSMNYYHGVDPQRFACLMFSSGLLFNPSMTWVGFHMTYDIGYMVKVLTHTYLPDSMEGFLNLVRTYFGMRIFDIKHLAESCEGLEGGLERVAGKLNVRRAGGTSHNAGSDSLLTWDTFRSMRMTFLREDIDTKQAGVLFGIQDS